MSISPITLAVWGVWGTLRTEPWSSYRIVRLKRRSDGKEGWACVGPAMWGRYGG